jgi:hypothetical protein
MLILTRKSGEGISNGINISEIKAGIVILKIHKIIPEGIIEFRITNRRYITI